MPSRFPSQEQEQESLQKMQIGICRRCGTKFVKKAAGHCICKKCEKKIL